MTDENGTVPGRVTSGMGAGATFVSLPGYATQFVDRLGYEPFPGTLNVSLESGSPWRAARRSLPPVRIDGWEARDRTYGPARCYPVALAADGRRYEPAHVIVPERSDYGPDRLEVLAPTRLRDALDLADGDRVNVHVRPDGD